MTFYILLLFLSDMLTFNHSFPMIQVEYYYHYRHDSKMAVRPAPDYTDYWNRTSDIYLVGVALYQLS